MLAAVVRWSLERPRLIAWACLWFLVCGALWVSNIRYDLLPELAPAETSIQTEAPGLVAEQVESLVTRPIETPLIGAAGVAAVHSESVQGLSVVTIRFAPGAEPNRVRETIAERLSGLAGALPDGVSPPRLAPLTPRRALVLEIGFTGAKLDPMALRDVVQWTVRPRLLAATGVARVAVYGGQIRRIEVRARPADLSDSDLGFLDILNAARRATSVAGAGFIDTDAQRVEIEPRGQALTKEDVGAGQIQVSGAAPVRIDDVADVVEAPAPASGDALIDGKPGVLVEVARQYGANALETTHAVEAALAALKPALAAQGVAARTDLDRPASFATAALHGLALDLAIGAGLIAAALLLLLGDLRGALISMISIPLSLLAAVVALKALGMTLNAMTLGGIAVGLAVVIDDAVIDVENIVANLRDAEERHASRLEAVLAASLQVRGPVIYATLAVIVSLAPILVLRGVPGALLAPLAVAVIAAALASLVVAAVVTPALCLLFLSHVGPAPDPPALRRAKAAHERSLSWFCPRRRVVMAVSAALVVLAVVALPTFPAAITPSVADGELVARASGPPASSLDVSRDFGQRIAAAVRPLAGVRSISQRIGRDPTGDDSWGPERSAFNLALAPGLDLARQRRIAGQVLDRLRVFPGLAPTVTSRFDSLRLGDRPGAPFQVGVYGQDLDALEAAADRIAAAINALPGARDVRVDNPPRAPVVRVDVNFQRLALFGLSSADVLATVQAAFEGERVAQIYEGGRVVDLAVSAQESLRRDPEAVGDLLLRSTSGISVPLKAVANVYLTDDRAVIAHDGGLRRELVTASPRDTADFTRRARRAIEGKVALPPGAFIEFGAPGAADDASGNGLLIDYVLAVFVIFGVLAIAFDGRTGALILASTLFALIGAVAAVALMGGVLSLGAVAGFVALFGLSMRGAILLFAELEERVLTKQAPWSLQTVAQAAGDRLAPVLISALLVALALTPLALHAGEAGREILGPMAIVILGGLVTSTLGVLFALPAIILALWRPAWARRARRRGTAARGA
ncbi:MAG TPA: efflux RND transporter permease subunit [Caulobacteraceae bacterium]|nr:efflux RND transporter permease subunit [Caulobacteraceae bacterium]